MLHEVDQSIKNLLFTELRKATNGLVHAEDQIVVGPPDAAASVDHPQIHLFLHDVHENVTLRDQSFEIRRGASEWEVGKSRKATRLNLSYLLTTHAKDPGTEHRLLGESIGVLLRHGFVPEEHLVGSLKPFQEEAVVLSVAQRDHWAHADGPKVWQATGLPLRPFVGIVAAAMFDPFETRTVRLVREALLAIGQGTGPNGPDRQMDIRSIRMSAGGAVSGPNGEPLTDVKVAVEGHADQTTSDAQGVFFFQNLPPGKHRLTFSKRGYQEAQTEVTAPPRGRSNEFEPVAVQMRIESDEGRAQALRTSFSMEPGVSTLVGTLRYADGRAAPFVPVRIGDRTAVTDEEGMYFFTQIPGGTQELIAEIPGRGETSIKVKAGADAATLPKP